MAKKWIATIIYNRGFAHIEPERHEIEELDEIAEIVERGENYYNVHEIRIVHNPDNLADMGYQLKEGYHTASATPQ